MIIVGNFNIPPIQQLMELLGKKSQGYRQAEQHNPQDLINIYETGYPTIAKYIFLNCLWNIYHTEKMKKTNMTNVRELKSYIM